MKTNFTILALLIFCMNGSAQIASTKNEFKITWGAEYEFPKKHYDMGFWKGEKGGYVNISYRDRESMVIQRFDSKMKYIGEETVDLKEFPKNFVSEGIRLVGEKFYWFYSIWDKEREREQLFVQELDVDAGKLRGTAKKLLETEKLSGDKFKFSRSRDMNVLLITYNYPKLSKDDSKNYERMGWQVFNSSLEKIWGKEAVKMPYTEEFQDTRDWLVDSKGTVYLLASVLEVDWKQLKKEKKGFKHFEVLRLDDKSDGFSKIKVNPGTRRASDVNLSEDAHGDLLVTGFYSNNVHSYGSNGVFLLKVEQGSLSAKEVKKGYYEFPKELLQQFESEKTKKKMDKREEKAKEDDEEAEAEASNLTMQDVELAEDGSIILSAEEYYYVVHRVRSSNGSYTTSYTYYYNDIITMKINAAGEMEWIHKIPKRQVGQNTSAGLGFVMFTMNGSHYYFYLDNIKNLNLSKDMEPAAHMAGAGGFLVYSKIDETGQLTKGKIMDLREEEVTIYGDDFERVDETQIVTRAKVKKLSKILSLSLVNAKL